MEMIKCFEITPSTDSSYDSMIVKADNTWGPAMRALEAALETQFLKLEERGLSWKDIKVEVKCVEMTEDDFEDLCNEG